ncbi:LPXTG cell wall anchor domain-containing protein [Vagococcus intermedius]|uniref:LPXTG cell wall anchor domain-containing protein n=1 Tax=Vagococcus intermedius TaxID=2991418 RepID=A0AAF0I6M1_9ENTE|nr:LPXTG cell wall anchor domain-containing protein [Vagococcus intermedius]WEG73648.1 LPXTG cell wall anchor domain-containing protein [Vagococcus intermedius]WEG75732.1 LPXTG cell wall anchor domain-containing protein [Vagococcus intermedius]
MTVKKIVLTTLLGLMLGSFGSIASQANEIDEVTTDAQVEFLNDAPKPSPPIPPEIKPDDQEKPEKEKIPSDNLASNDELNNSSIVKPLDKESHSLRPNKPHSSLDNGSGRLKGENQSKWLGYFPQTGELSSNKLLNFGLLVILIVGVLYIKNKKNKHRESY